MKEFYTEGTYRTRGRMIGESYRAEIKDIMEIMKTQEIPAMFRNEQWEETVYKFAYDTGIFYHFKKSTGELYEEVEGMAEGSGVDVRELIILNSLDEISSYSCQNGITDKCTCIGIKRKHDGGVFIAQNLDLSAHLNKHQMILHVKYENSDLEQLIFTIPGLLGFTGVNNRSVAVVPNALTTLKYNTKGMPVTAVVRGILERDTAEQSACFVKRITHGAAQNYTIGDRNGIISLECSGDRKEQFEPCNTAYFEYLVHTNHPLINDDISVPGRVNMPVSSYESTTQRLNTADTCLKTVDYSIDEKGIQAILTSHEHEPNCICRHGSAENNGMTIGSVIYRLGKEIEMYFAKGPGCINPYEKFKLKGID